MAKIIQMQDSAHTVTFLKIESQNAPDCISAHVHFMKFPGGGGGACLQTPLGSLWPSATWDLFPQTIIPR